MRYIPFTLTTAALLLAGAAQADAYKCTVGGKIVYQDIKCETNADEKVVVRGGRTGGSNSSLNLEQMTTYPNEEFAQSLMDMRLLTAKRLGAPSQDEVKNCVEKYRPMFKDPQSVYPVESIAVDDNGKPFVVISVSAKNGFGGATRRKIACAQIAKQLQDSQ